MRSIAAAAVVAALFVSVAALAQVDIPLDKQKGVRGRVIIDPAVLTTPVPITGDREKLLRSPAIVRRPLGRPVQPLEEPAPGLVIMLEGEGIRSDAVTQKVVVEGMRFQPSSVVLPRPMSLQIENKQPTPITIMNAGAAIGTLKPGEVKEFPLQMAGAHKDSPPHLLRIKEMPFASATVRVLERGRVLPLQGDEIPLVEIPGGTYQLTFFFGAEPLRIQPLNIPDLGLVFIDATVSANKVVEVAVKDASMRVAVPPSLRQPPPDDAP